MKTLVAISSVKSNSNYHYIGDMNFGTIKIPFGIIEVGKPKFDTSLSENDDYVLLQVKAISCNYRDKAILIENYKKFKKKNISYTPFGSEFCASVISKGSNVSEFEVGETVIPNCFFSDSRENGTGIPTNFASMGWLKIHKNKIITSPKNLTHNEAAGFSLGAQTATAMIRKINILNTGGTPLVFSARSTTSIFLIKTLLAHNITPICLTTTKWSNKEKRLIYPSIIEKIDKHKYQTLEKIKKKNITHVFDPFFDMNIGDAMYCLDNFGTYITCGLRDQHPLFSSNTPLQHEPKVRNAIRDAIFKNITIIGNCLGKSKDLEDAIKLIEKGSLHVPIDCIYPIDKGINFLTRTFCEKNKLGKCILEL